MIVGYNIMSVSCINVALIISIHIYYKHEEQDQDWYQSAHSSEIDHTHDWVLQIERLDKESEVSDLCFFAGGETRG